MPAALASAGVDSSIGAPSSSRVPESGRCTPASILTSVDLPAPFSPTSACASPPYRSKDTFWTAATAPNDLETSRTRSTGASVAIATSVGLDLFVAERFQEDCLTARASVKRQGEVCGEPQVDPADIHSPARYASWAITFQAGRSRGSTQRTRTRRSAGSCLRPRGQRIFARRRLPASRRYAERRHPGATRRHSSHRRTADRYRRAPGRNAAWRSGCSEDRSVTVARRNARASDGENPARPGEAHPGDRRTG